MGTKIAPLNQVLKVRHRDCSVIVLVSVSTLCWAVEVERVGDSRALQAVRFKPSLRLIRITGCIA